jgi:hypothetical protein
MSDYAYTAGGTITRKADGAIIPADLRNADYQTFLASKETPDAYVAPPPSVAQSLAAAIAAGCALQSTATPALDATYAIAGPLWNDLKDEAQYIQTFGAFSAGQTAIAWLLPKGGTVTFATTAQLLAVVRGLGDYLTALKLAAMQPNWTAPAQPSVIA